MDNEVTYVAVNLKCRICGSWSSSKWAAEQIDYYKKELLEYWEELPPYVITSSETGLGSEEILDFISQTNTVFQM